MCVSGFAHQAGRRRSAGSVQRRSEPPSHLITEVQPLAARVPQPWRWPRQECHGTAFHSGKFARHLPVGRSGHTHFPELPGPEQSGGKSSSVTSFTTEAEELGKRSY